jgi:hypothetical protein
VVVVVVVAVGVDAEVVKLRLMTGPENHLMTVALSAKYLVVGSRRSVFSIGSPWLLVVLSLVDQQQLLIQVLP